MSAAEEGMDKNAEADPAIAVDSTDNYEALIQFLYRAPIGLVQISASGTIE